MNNIHDNFDIRVKKKQDEYRAAILQDNIVSLKEYDEIVKIHQKTTWQVPFNWNLSKEILDWNLLTEYTDILPEIYEEKIDVSTPRMKVNSFLSTRQFDKSYTLNKEDFSQLLYLSFGRMDDYPSKAYPSAGGLYPVFPLIYLLDTDAVCGINEKGIYAYDATQLKLLLVQDLEDEKNYKKVINNINCIQPGFLPSKIAIGYALDLKRAITKYKKRGYRHGLIEVGLMLQSLRNALNQIDNDLGDLSWSGFNDNALTHASGLNTRSSPIILLQWVGKKYVI